MNKLFTSESVTEGHPDKLCDLISDAVLDYLLHTDKHSRVACETSATTGLVLVMGEITTNAYAPIQDIVRQTVLSVGYDRAKYGFDGETCAVISAINPQSPDIAMGIGSGLSQGAGDQGMMFGYACDQTPEYMPLPISLAHSVTRRLAAVRKSGELLWLRPDGKSQITVEYDGNNNPLRVDTVVISTQHDISVSHEDIKSAMLAHVVPQAIPAHLLDENTKYFINPTGRFVEGGPKADSGLTGRKIIVDTYGGYARHGGGAFSGKDPSKVDRSAAYAARHAAKNIVASGLARACELQLAYAIGVAAPVSVAVDTFGTGVTDDNRLAQIINQTFDFRPAAIIERFDLCRPIYSATAAYGHFGRQPEDAVYEYEQHKYPAGISFPWERLDYVDELKRKA